MKKGIIGLALALVVASGVFAQDIKNWISGEVSIFGAGVRYERMLNPKMSIGANVYFDSLFLWHDFGADFSFRFYPWGSRTNVVRGLFFGGALGFHIHWGFFNYGGYGYYYYDTVYDWWGRTLGAAITPDIGWRLDVGKPGGFFIEPGMKLPITLGVHKNYWGENKFRANVGYVPYVGLGFAF